eukprot:c19325_g2_i1 orf=151-537(+)
MEGVLQGSLQYSFRDASHITERSHVLRLNQTRELLWIDGSHTSSLVTEDLRRRGGVKTGQFCVRKDKVLKAHRELQDRTALFNLIKACGKQKDLLKGSKLHADILERGLLKKDISLGNALLSMYAKCG